MSVTTEFPARWSRLLGGVTAASLAVSILSGGFLALYFDPSMATVTYDGPFANLRGVEMTRAYASLLEISFEVRGGLLIRQLQAWAASVFVASLLVNLALMFFTGAVRGPHRRIWTSMVLLLIGGIFYAFTGVLLPGDMLSDTSLRMISGYVLSIPVVGTWLHWTVFGGEFPGTEIIPRLYVVHWLLAGGLVALVVRRAKLLGRLGPARLSRHSTVAVAAATAGVLVLMAGLFQVNPIWNYGPGNAAHVSAGSAPPWYFGWVDGAVRLMPPWEIQLGGYTIPPWFWPSMVFLPLTFLALAMYPWLDRRLTRDDGARRTSLGVAVLTGYGCLQLAAGIDVLAFHFGLSADALLWAGRVGVLALPPLAYLVTYRLCLGVRLRRREVEAHGVPTGMLRRLPHGEFVDEHRPLGVSSGPAADHRLRPAGRL
jgi:ubiquinol-cytochrome c reductase cytochrome b subunit